MPKVSYLKTKSTRLNAAYKQMNGITELIKGKPDKQIDIAAIMGVSPGTLRKKLDNPELFTLEELARLCIEYNMLGAISIQNGSGQINIKW